MEWESFFFLLFLLCFRLFFLFREKRITETYFFWYITITARIKSEVMSEGIYFLVISSKNDSPLTFQSKVKSWGTVIRFIFVYSRVRNKHSPTLINFLTSFQGLQPYSGLHRVYLSSISIRYKWGYAYSFCQIFQGLRLFKGLCLFQTLEYGDKNETTLS
jgi:hypothetical protein